MGGVALHGVGVGKAEMGQPADVFVHHSAGMIEKARGLFFAALH